MNVTFEDKLQMTELCTSTNLNQYRHRHRDSKIEHFSPRKPLSFLGLIISKVTLSCSQYLYDIIQVAFPRYLS